MSEADDRTLRRWRLVLGRYAEQSMQLFSAEDQKMDRVLDQCYGRAYGQRGIRRRAQKRGASLDGSQLALVGWLKEMRTLFPSSVYETVQGHAIEQFGLTDILRDPKALAEITPDMALLKMLVAFKGRADPAMREAIRAVARKVVEDLMRRIRAQVMRALAGARRRNQPSSRKSLADFDWRGTIRANLVNWSAERNAIIAARLKFHGRARRRLGWTIILCVDQSGSMVGSVIHAAVMAAILTSLPSVSVKLVVFDTAVVDLTEQAGDPIEVLMSVQLGGGTDIGKAVAYCERLVATPPRTMFVLISDFMEGAAPGPLLAAVKRLRESGVTLLGLAALGEDGQPEYDHAMAQSLADRGMKVAALSPEHFAQWVAGIIN